MSLGFQDLMQSRACELGVIKRKQRFEITDDIRRNSPFTGLMRVRQRVLNGIFGDLELLGRQISITGALQVPAEVHRMHELVDQVAIAMAVTTSSQCEMTR
jgi:hypothetical protein